MTTLDNREHARSLRRRLQDHSLDIESLALEAMQVFTEGEHAPLIRWLKFELTGYTCTAESSSVHELLGLEPSERLVVRVKTYRNQTGLAVAVDANSATPGAPFHHFFVEPLRLLADEQARQRARPREGSPSIRLDFAARDSKFYRPAAGDFPADTFDRILLGFRAVLHLQLGEIAAA